jgi:DNA-binding transcriptional MocR family regulator
LPQLPGVIWLAGGTPHGSTFPFAKFSATLRDGTVVEMSGDEARARRRARTVFASKEQMRAAARAPAPTPRFSARRVRAGLRLASRARRRVGVPRGVRVARGARPMGALALRLTWRAPLAARAQAYECQQYCMNSAGHPPLVAWLSRHVSEVHAPPRRVAHLVTSGNTCAIDLVLRTLLNRGDCALVEEFTYSATLQARRICVCCALATTRS